MSSAGPYIGELSIIFPPAAKNIRKISARLSRAVVSFSEMLKVSHVPIPILESERFILVCVGDDCAKLGVDKDRPNALPTFKTVRRFTLRTSSLEIRVLFCIASFTSKYER